MVQVDEGSNAADARNRGFESAAAEVAFGDADDLVHPGWVLAMGEALLVHGMVSGQIESASLNPGTEYRSIGS